MRPLTIIGLSFFAYLTFRVMVGRLGVGANVRILAVIGLTFLAYCAFRVIVEWRHRNAVEKTLWLAVIVVGGAGCTYLLLWLR